MEEIEAVRHPANPLPEDDVCPVLRGKEKKERGPARLRCGTGVGAGYMLP
jgi:hypothetical protein